MKNLAYTYINNYWSSSEIRYLNKGAVDDLLDKNEFLEIILWRIIYFSEDDMPFWKKDSKKDCENGGKSKEKVNYKARLEHKQYLVSLIIVLVLSLLSKDEH